MCINVAVIMFIHSFTHIITKFTFITIFFEVFHVADSSLGDIIVNKTKSLL